MLISIALILEGLRALGETKGKQTLTTLGAKTLRDIMGCELFLQIHFLNSFCKSVCERLCGGKCFANGFTGSLLVDASWRSGNRGKINRATIVGIAAFVQFLYPHPTYATRRYASATLDARRDGRTDVGAWVCFLVSVWASGCAFV